MCVLLCCVGVDCWHCAVDVDLKVLCCVCLATPALDCWHCSVDVVLQVLCRVCLAMPALDCWHFAVDAVWQVLCCVCLATPVLDCWHCSVDVVLQELCCSGSHCFNTETFVVYSYLSTIYYVEALIHKSNSSNITECVILHCEILCSHTVPFLSGQTVCNLKRC